MAYSTHIRSTAPACSERVRARPHDYAGHDLPKVFGQLFELFERCMMFVQQRPVLTVAAYALRSAPLTLHMKC